MSRTTTDAVQRLLGNDYAPDADLTPSVESASAVVDRVVACATAKGKALTAAEAELVERWLSAHFYCQSDPQYQSKSTMGASGGFTGQTGMRLDNTRYGQQAQVIDYSGCLSAIGKRAVATGGWLGKTESEQLTYEERMT